MYLLNCGGLLFLALGAFAAIIETPQASPQLTDEARIKSELQDPEFFFISKLSGLWQAIKDEKGILKAERRAEHCSMKKAIAMDYHYDKNLLFWSTYDGGIYTCPMRGRSVPKGEVKQIYLYSDWYPVSMAVDYISDLLYIIDSKTNTLSIMSLDGSTGTNMIRSFDPVVGKDFQPRYLEVDPFEGVLFFMDHYNAINHIYRMNIDGSDPRPIDNDGFRRQRRMGSFTLDRNNQRILVSSPFDRAIVSVNYQGGDTRPIISAENYASTLTIDRKNSYLYFVNITAYAPSSLEDKVADIMKTDLYRCSYSLVDEKCAPGTVELIDDGEWWALLQLKIVSEPTRRAEQNHCDRRPCQHMCIYTAKRDDYKCRCRTGFRLASDGRCESIDEFLIYENDNYVGGIDVAAPEPGLDRANDEVFTPFKIGMRPTGDDQFGFDYDPLQERLLYSNDHEVIVKYLNNALKYTTLINPTKSYGLLAIDSTSNQFYFVEISTYSSDYSTAKFSIGVSSIIQPPLFDSIDAVPQRTVMKLLRSNIGRVRSLAVYPALGYVFYVSYDANVRKFGLTRMMVDGSKVTNISAELGPVEYMALDYEERKIYYIDNEEYCVRRADFDGKNAEKVIRLPIEGGSPLGCINGFSVLGDWIYVKDRNDIRRCNKTQSFCQQWERYDPKPFNFDMRTQLRFHSTKTSATMTTPCSDEQKSGCQQLCFALPDAEGKLQAQCACDDGYELKSDKKTCSEKAA